MLYFFFLQREETEEKETNALMEQERKLQDGEGVSEGASASIVSIATSREIDDSLEAEKQWEKHVGLNQSVIVDSFQGQFKSTVSRNQGCLFSHFFHNLTGSLDFLGCMFGM